jgi:hypothetical protein
VIVRPYIRASSEGSLRVEGHLRDFAHLGARRAPWVVAGRWKRSIDVSMMILMGSHTISDLDLDAGVSLGHISHRSHNPRHGGGRGCLIALEEAATMFPRVFCSAARLAT